tara:strand:- start:730 stop:1155 length:426 start_codon:yes stop_codon:yes gene_type:complete
VSLKPITSADLTKGKSRRFTDVNIAFSKNRFTDDCSKVSNENAIKQAIKNLVLTRPGEKLFRSNVGCGVYQRLFEQLDAFSIDTIQSDIINTINQYESRVQLLACNLVPHYSSGKVNVSVRYKVVGLPIVESIAFVLQRPT